MKHLFMAVLVMFAFSSTANAMSFNPDSDSLVDWGQADNGTNTNNNSILKNYLQTKYGLVYQYKNENGPEEGDFASYYSTSFDSNEASAATITWDGPDAIGPNDRDYLLVKDGSHDPYWYLFDLTGWNGEKNLVMTGFWPDEGSISHVAILGDANAPVPEPATMLLFGTGLVGLAGIARRRNKK